MFTAAVIALLLVSMAATIAGSAVQGVQAKQAADFQEDQYKAQAEATRKKGFHEGERRRRLNRIAMRRMDEKIGMSGMAGDFGTPLDSYLNNVAQQELHALNVEADAIYAQDSLLGQADAARAAGVNNQISVGISGVADVANVGLSGAVALGAGSSPSANPTSQYSDPWK